MMATQEVIHGGKKVLREVQKEADEARARAEAAEKTLETERAARATELKTVESRAEAEARRLRAALSQLMEAESVATARSLHISELTSAIQAAECQAREAEERARRAEEKAKRAEEMTEEANERAAAAEYKMRAAEEEADRSREAERAATASLAAEIGARVVEVEAALEGRVARAMEEFRASEQFMDELVAASTDAFSQGFQHGKEKVARDLNFPAALEVEPESLSEAGTPINEPAPDDQ